MPETIPPDVWPGESAIREADALLPGHDYLEEAAYLVSRGVRPLALAGHCRRDPDVMLRVRTRLAIAAQRFDVLVFVQPEPRLPDSAAFGFAAHRWVIDLLGWLDAPEVPRARAHEILGLLLGYSAPAIARHQEREGLWEPDAGEVQGG